MDANVTPGGADALAEALREMLSQYDWTDPAATVEALAEEFYQEMGVMAPGKSVPIGMDQPSDDERRSRYGRWIRQRGQRICNAARAALAAQRPGPRDEPEEAASLRSDIAGLEAELMTLSRLADIAADDLARALYDAEVESREDDGSVEPDTAEAWDELPDEGDEASKAEWRAHAARVIAALASLERAERANESSSGGVSRPDGAATPRADDEGAGSQARPADALPDAAAEIKRRWRAGHYSESQPAERAIKTLLEVLADTDARLAILARTEGAATAGEPDQGAALRAERALMAKVASALWVPIAEAVGDGGSFEYDAVLELGLHAGLLRVEPYDPKGKHANVVPAVDMGEGDDLYIETDLGKLVRALAAETEPVAGDANNAAARTTDAEAQG